MKVVLGQETLGRSEMLLDPNAQTGEDHYEGSNHSEHFVPMDTRGSCAGAADRLGGLPELVRAPVFFLGSC